MQQRSERAVYNGSYGDQPLAVREIYEEGGSILQLTALGETLHLQKYTAAQLAAAEGELERPYLGLSREQVLQSGADLLGRAVLAQGEVAPRALRGILPPLSERAYACLSGHASWFGVIVDVNGDLRAQPHRGTSKPLYLFRPGEYEKELGALKPVQLLLNGELPILFSLHAGAARSLELLHFVEPGDPASNPVVWTRALVRDNDSGAVLREELLLLGLEMDEACSEVPAEAFWDAFAGAARYWQRFLDGLARLDLPEPALVTALRGCMGTMATTFTADHPHYGHGVYGWEIHDHFPPTFLTAMETCAALGQLSYARRMLEHMLNYAIDESGRFCYRQGARHENGAAASEYGQFLWLVERYAGLLPPEGWLDGHLDALRGVGRMLMRSRRPCASQPDLRLIHMCAEADTNGRVYDYLQNSFWAARGLQALAALLARLGQQDGAQYADEARDLLRDAREAVRRERAETRFGPLPPFQMGYTARPLTLSACRETFDPVDDAQYARYLQWSDVRGPIEGAQNYVENTYANYRYYLEMLSSRCLEPEEERALVRLREELGGELLGMTRFLDRVDDWPVFNYARYLLETDRLDKYLLLLYAHLEYHGRPELKIYYEQCSIDGKVVAPDCVPSLMIAPLMVAWMLAFEPVGEQALYLLRGAPARWFAEGFACEGLYTRWGEVSVRVEAMAGGARIEVRLPPIPPEAPVYLDARCGASPHVEPAEAVLSREGARLRLRPGTRALRLEVRAI